MADDDDSAPDLKQKPHDIVLVHGRTEDGEGLRALRSRPERMELAEIRPAREGKPLPAAAELIQLRRRAESPLLYDVDVQFGDADRGGEASHGGPPKVASHKYRENWDAIFGKKRGHKMLN